jgi:hypothetical protein
MEHCDKMFVNALKDGVTGKDLEIIEEEYDEARRMYRSEKQPMNRPFNMRFFDVTADNGVAIIRFDPTFDRVPSTGELVTTLELGRKYFKELKHDRQGIQNRKTVEEQRL